MILTAVTRRHQNLCTEDNTKTIQGEMRDKLFCSTSNNNNARIRQNHLPQRLLTHPWDREEAELQVGGRVVNGELRREEDESFWDPVY